jgi:hypothetical protein
MSQVELCYIDDNLTKGVVITIFFMSFVLFRYISSIFEKSDEEKRNRINQAESYFSKHIIENKEFFN